MNRRRTVAGLASMALGAAAVVAGLAAPAAAHDGQEPDEIDNPYNMSCAQLAEHYGIGVDWIESKIDSGSLPPAGESATYELVESDSLEPGYEGDGPRVTITMNTELKNFDFDSSVGIDAVYVKGGSDGSYFTGYQPEIAGYNADQPGEILGDGAEVTSGRDRTTPPYHDDDKNQISHITFCWDEEGTGTTSTTETPPSTDCPDVTVSGGNPDENPPYDETPPGEDECDTPDTTPTTEPTPSTEPPSPTSTVPIDTGDSTTVIENPAVPGETTTTTVAITPEGSLPNTGSNTTTPLILGGLALLAVGGGLVAGKRWLRRA